MKTKRTKKTLTYPQAVAVLVAMDGDAVHLIGEEETLSVAGVLLAVIYDVSDETLIQDIYKETERQEKHYLKVSSGE